MEYKSSIICIILLQARSFVKVNMTGKTPCLGELFHMVKLVKAEICEMISHVDVPKELLRSPRKGWSGKTQDKRENSDNMEDTSPNKRKATRLIQPYSVEMKNTFDLPMKEANNPGINCICEFCVVSKESLIPNLGPKYCIQLLFTGNCKYRKTCKFGHKTVTKVQIVVITDKFGCFLKNTSTIKGDKSHTKTPKTNSL